MNSNINSSTQEFIKKSVLIHNNKFDYSKVKYLNNHTKIEILCPIHGSFMQKPNGHLNGKGCVKCAGRNRTSKDLIREFINIHNNEYDYSLVKYVMATKKVDIICKIHGIFKQVVSTHLNGHKCPKCSHRHRPTKKEFIEKANVIFNKRYDYSLVNYKNNKTKVKIICPTHGVFEQKPNCHLSGRGCAHCRESKGERKISVFLDNVNIKYIRQQKFENCTNTITGRMLPFDFYLPNYNLLIEYDGRQHFKYWERFHNNTLEEIKKRDCIKTEFANNNGFKLLRIKYTKFKEIEDILQSHLRVK